MFCRWNVLTVPIYPPTHPPTNLQVSPLHLSRHKSGSDHCSCYHGFCRPQRKQTVPQATVNINALFTVGDIFVSSWGDSRITLLQSVSKSHHFTWSGCQWLAFHSARIRGEILLAPLRWNRWSKGAVGVVFLLWPQQMPSLWPSVQIVIIKRKEKRMKRQMQGVGVRWGWGK